MSNALEHKTPEIISLRIEMRQRGITTAKLAELTKSSKRTVENFYSNPHLNKALRLRIERVLDKAIWSTFEEHIRRKALTKILKFDPCTEKLGRLRVAAKKYRVTGSSMAVRKAALIVLMGEQLLKRNTPVSRRKKRRAKYEHEKAI